MRPIPITALKYNVDVYPFTGMDKFNKPSYGTKVTCERVYLEPSTRFANKSNSDYKDDKLFMIYDFVNSTPNIVFKQDDKIVFNGKNYYVRDFDNLFDHHLEIYLK